jgi:hypothetical protein
MGDVWALSLGHMGTCWIPTRIVAITSNNSSGITSQFVTCKGPIVRAVTGTVTKLF